MSAAGIPDGLLNNCLFQFIQIKFTIRMNPSPSWLAD